MSGSCSTSSVSAMSSLPLTNADLCAEMGRLQRELSAEMRTAMMDSQDVQIAAMQEALKREFAESAAKGQQGMSTGRRSVLSRKMLARSASDDALASKTSHDTADGPAQADSHPHLHNLALPIGHLSHITHLKSAAAHIAVDDYYHELHVKKHRPSIAKTAGRNSQRDSRQSQGGRVSDHSSAPSRVSLRGSGQADVTVASVAHKSLANGGGETEEQIMGTVGSQVTDDYRMDQASSELFDASGGSLHNPDFDVEPTYGGRDSIKAMNLLTKGSKVWESDMSDEPPDRTLIEILVEKQPMHEKLTDLVLSTHFEAFIGFVVIVNAMYIGLQTDFTARWGLDSNFVAIDRVVDTCFCTIFLMEIFLRIYVHRIKFLTSRSDRGWNIFDFFVVSVQVLELLIVWSDSSEKVPKNFSGLRILRILRAIRILRLVKILRPLRILVTSILGSLGPLFWTVMLLFFEIYLMGVFLTQSVADYKVSIQDNDDVELDPDQLERLDRYFGNLMKGMLCLFQSVSGGVDWEDMVDPLMHNISAAYGVLFTAYIAFSLLALMNVVSGYFVQSALENTKRENETYMVTLVRQVLSKLDVDRDGQITWTEFEDALHLKEMQEYFKTVDVDISDAQSLWNLLDVDSQGYIDAEDLLNGCIRMQGHASALGQNLVMRELGRLMAAMDQCRADLAELSFVDERRRSIAPQGSVDSAATAMSKEPPPKASVHASFAPDTIFSSALNSEEV